MVKPTKNMEPESVDLTKAGRRSGTSFQDDSFRNHIARKIDLQRKQFGLVVPPDPTDPRTTSTEDTQQAVGNNVTNSESKFQTAGRGFHEDGFRNYMTRKIDMQRLQLGLVIPPDPRLLEEEKNQQPKEDLVVTPRRLAVRFADDVKEGSNDTRTRKKRDGTDINITSIVDRLKQRHGRRLSRHRRKRRRATFDSSFSVDAEIGMQCQVERGSIERESNLLSEDTVATISQSLTSPRNRRPDLFFSGVVVLVNGYTNPDAETLQRLLQKHGGDLEKYETSRVTHIIAEHLSAAKAKIYRQRRRPVPVCYPAWITESVDSGHLIPHANYLIQEVIDENVVTVKAFFGTSTKALESTQQRQSDSIDASALKFTAQSQLWDDSILKTNVSVELMSSANTCRLTEKGNVEGNDLVRDLNYKSSHDVHVDAVDNDVTLHMNERQSTDLSKGETYVSLGVIDLDSQGVKASEKVDGVQLTGNKVYGESVLNEHGTGDALDGNKSLATASTSKLGTDMSQELNVQQLHDDAQGSEDSMDDSNGLTTSDRYINGRVRTVGTDPNFLESFFNSSRLSFIGSYKQRIQKLAGKRESGNRQRAKDDQRLVFHVDMDCFFAAVALRNYPEYQDKPVAISHHGKRGDGAENQSVVSKNSTSECATCNYEARKFGITKGMFLGRAKELCPELVVLYYDFEGYEEVSEQVADILHRQAMEYNGTVEQVSCDESYAEMFFPSDDVSGTAFMLAGAIAESLREEICSETQCTASIGVGLNKLLAKLATDKVKPNGSYVVADHRELLCSLNLRDLHGVGYRMEQRLAAEGLVSVCDVWGLGGRAEGVLCRILGTGLGKKIHQFCKGEDDRPVKAAERKTIGASCNYGVRFDGPYGVDYMIAGLSKEVQRRMEAINVRGSRVTLKVKQRKEGAKPPPKFLGHGSCHNLSKSLDTPSNAPTRDWEALSRICNALFLDMKVPTDDVRGMGVTVSRLVFDDKQGGNYSREPSLMKWLGGSPHTLHCDDKVVTVPVPVANREVLETKQTPHKMSVSFAPMTLVRSFTEDEVIEIEQNLSPPAESAYYDTRCSVEILSPSDQDIETEKDFADSPFAPRNLCFTSMEVGSARQILDDISGENEQFGIGAAALQHVRIVRAPQSPDCHDVALPPLSQIHMSQVAFLPSQMRKMIQEKIDIATKDTVDSCYSEQAKPATDDNMQPRLRQMSVKRMLKLAAVKSRVETLSDRLGDSVSLTQLEYLPLEMQLQIANNDELTVGMLSPDKSHRPTKKSYIFRNPTERGPVHHQGACIESDDRELIVIDSVDSWDHCEIVFDASNENMHAKAESNATVLDDKGTFYHDNIAPLHAFLDENPEASKESVNHVKEFLCMCVSEQRPRDVVLLLRSIKNHANQTWSQMAYKTILEEVNERCHRMLGAPLDVDWLGLTPPLYNS